MVKGREDAARPSAKNHSTFYIVFCVALLLFGLVFCCAKATKYAAMVMTSSSKGSLHWALIGAALGIGSVVWYGAAPITYFKYRHIPGDRGIWLLGSLRELADSKIENKEGYQRILVDVYRDHMKKHGRIFKFMFGRRMPMIIVVDPEVVQEIGMRKFSKLQDRPKIGASYALAAGKDGHARERIEKGLLFLRGGLWRGVRNALLPLFHSDVLSHFTPVMNSASKTLLRKLEDVKDGEIVNIHNMFGGYTQEIIGTSVFGKHFDSQSVPEASGDVSINPETSSMDGVPLSWKMYRAVATIFANSSGDINALLSLLCPVLLPVLQFLSQYFPTEDAIRTRKAINVMSEVGEEMLDEAKNAQKLKKGNADANGQGESGKGEKSMSTFEKYSEPLMQKMLSAKDKETGRYLSDNENIAQSTTFIAGGTETTASTLSYAIYLLSQNEEAEAEIMKEVDACPEDEPSYEYIMENFQYIQAAIYETLRLYPSGGFISRFTNCEVQIGPYKVPADTPVIIPLVLLQTLPEHFPEPLQFKPERFIPPGEGADSKYANTWHKYAYIPFGMGPRICIGYRLAMAEATLALFRLYRNYSFRIATPLTPIPNLPLKQGLTLQPKDGVCVRVYRRKI